MDSYFEESNYIGYAVAINSDGKKARLYGPAPKTECCIWMMENTERLTDYTLCVMPEDEAGNLPEAFSTEVESGRGAPVLHCPHCMWAGAREKCPVINEDTVCVACGEKIE